MADITPAVEALREELESRADAGLADSIAFEEEELLEDLCPELLERRRPPAEPRG